MVSHGPQRHKVYDSMTVMNGFKLPVQGPVQMSMGYLYVAVGGGVVLECPEENVWED
jgi:hypothetical protein